MAENKRWIVTTSGDRPLSDVTKDLTDTGFDVAEVYDQMGVISGAGGDDVADKLRKIAGVTDVSPDEVIDIGPPDSDMTW